MQACQGLPKNSSGGQNVDPEAARGRGGASAVSPAGAAMPVGRLVFCARVHQLPGLLALALPDLSVSACPTVQGQGDWAVEPGGAVFLSEKPFLGLGNAFWSMFF